MRKWPYVTYGVQDISIAVETVGIRASVKWKSAEAIVDVVGASSGGDPPE